MEDTRDAERDLLQRQGIPHARRCPPIQQHEAMRIGRLPMSREAAPETPGAPEHHILLLDPLELENVQVIVRRRIGILLHLSNHSVLCPPNLVVERWSSTATDSAPSP
jgi:hypothetical protein